MNTYKLFFPVMLLALIITSCSSEKDSYMQCNLKGDVKGVYTYNAVQKFGKLEKNELYNRLEFNKKGKVLTNEHIGHSKTIFKYEGNFLIEMESYDSDTLMEKLLNKYEGDKLIETCRYSSKGYLKEKTVFKYDGAKQIESNTYGADGSLISKMVNKFDGDKIVEIVQYESDGTKCWKMASKYHKNDKLAFQEFISFNKEGCIINSYYYKIDEHGNMIESGDDDGINSRNEFKYDSRGNLIESTVFNKDGSSEKFIYTNDEHGNWIEKKPADGSSKLTGEIREIVYY